MDSIKYSRVGRFNACIKCSQFQNSLSYCILHSKLHRSEQAFQDNLSTFSALNNLEYGEAQEFFLPSDPEQKIRERAESVVRPGTYMYRKGTSLGSPLGLNTYIHTYIHTYKHTLMKGLIIKNGPKIVGFCHGV